MKTKSLFIAALITVSAVLSAAGKEDPSKAGMVVVPVKGSEVFRIIYKGENTGKVKLKIYNADAKIVLSQTINGTDGFILPINFKGLAFGEYTVEVVNSTGKRVEKLTFAPEKNNRHVHVSKIANEVGKYLLSVANVKPTTIHVKIYDDNKNLVHTETKDITGNFAQVYKLTNYSASYSFEVSDISGNVKTVDF